MTIDTDRLTVANVQALATIIDAAARSTVVTWLADDNRLRTGVARHLVRGPEDFNFFDGDVRDAYLRVTSDGWELTFPVRELMDRITEGTFAVGDFS